MWAAAIAAALGGAAATVGSAGTQGAAGPLQAQADAVVPNKSEWTIMAYSLDRNQTLFAINAEQPKVPASNNKVYSSIWALGVLGPDYRFPTDLLINGNIQNGVLQGDVIIRGSGDPGFGYPSYEKDNLDPLRTMARRLKALGINQVTGSVIGDATIHDRQNFGPAWPLDTGMGAAHYAPTVSGLPYQRNMLWVEPNGQGPNGFVLHPDVPEIPVVWQSRGGRGYAVRRPEQDTVRLRGGIGRPGTRFPVGAFEPALLAPAALRQAMREAGIQVNGAVKLQRTPRGAKLAHRHLSLTLAEMVPQLNQHSDNFFAEHFWKAAVAKTTGQGSYTRGGPASANFFHRNAGVPYGQLWQADGSGLSANNRTSANSMVMTLKFADKAPYSRVFHESLAVAGDPGGTMKRMFVGTAAAGNLHAKTGYIRQVRSLSGYVKTASGERVAFSFIYNGRNTSGARGVQVALGNLLATYRR
ncbi:MAG TPA: D-alanyl-D-alanine carboxypeptidase/D-alanyl-D-alanine-endopeptidase [Longimicrobium sp.]|jgi:D-alanyl-D-alanine carboxypeptidase/D-alanyl-D-alanine-endopeptidase (penicillin-binding protein 4)